MKRFIIPDVVNQAELWTLPPSATVRDAARLMGERRIGALMVMDGQKLAGIFSERDLLNRVVVPGLNPDTTPLGNVMTRDPQTIGPKSTAIDALGLMHQHGFRHLPVADGDKVLGMVSIRDLYAAVKQELEEDLHDRETFIFGESYGAQA